MAGNFIPYTYLIGWSEHNRYYYGAKYGKDANPDLFWKKYFTSSDHVKLFREEHGEPDIIEIRKTFNDAKKALDWELKVLKRLKIKSNEKWLNVAIGKLPSWDGKKHSEETKRKMRKPKPEGFGEKVRKFHLNRKRSEETRKKISKARKGNVTFMKTWEFVLNDEKIIIKNLKKYCKIHGLNMSCMQDVFYGRQKSHKSYKKVLING